ncbi:hypothetical protein FACS1894140_4280 [Spirochaetia bacterium]|nr:hypothetical protein FACS1894140_4280 [Spirochaetia bacterium]
MIDKEHLTYQKNKWGFYQASPLPSEDDLQFYYNKQYYQSPELAGYSFVYDKDNFKNKKVCFERIALMIDDIRGGGGGKFLDIGCGEG